MQTSWATLAAFRRCGDVTTRAALSEDDHVAAQDAAVDMDHCSACRHRHRRQLEVERPHRRCRHSRKQEAAAAMRLQVARPCHKMRKVSGQLLLSQRFVDQLPGLECHLSLIAVIITFIAAFLHKHSHTHTHNNWAYSSVCCIIWLPLFPFTFRNSPHSFFYFLGSRCSTWQF